MLDNKDMKDFMRLLRDSSNKQLRAMRMGVNHEFEKRMDIRLNWGD